MELPVRSSRCYREDFLRLTNNSFVTSPAGPIYYVTRGLKYHSLVCKPCGPTYSLCDGSVKIRKFPDCMVDRLKSGDHLFDCEKQAPKLWEGNMFIRGRIPLNVILSEKLKPRINILITGVGRDFTGGPLSVMHFANELILQGFRVRWVNVDGEGLHEYQFRQHASKYNFLSQFVEKVEFIFNARSKLSKLICHPKDIFVATLYYTAQIAHFTTKSYNFTQKNFIYFIQDFEPIFFPHGSDFIEAHEGYRFPHFAIFSTPFLQLWFKNKKYGAYQFLDENTADLVSFATQPAIKRWPKLNISNFASPSRTRILLAYARKHADRNSYALLVDSLSQAVCNGIFPGNWKFIGLGATDDYILYLGGHCGLEIPFDIRKNIPEPEYQLLVRMGDIGLSLMISPHPSLPPLDFAAAGLITVTNSFETKTKELLLSISNNFIVTLPYLEDIVNGLSEAVQKSMNISLRQYNADHFQWEQYWNGSNCYGNIVMNKLRAWLLVEDLMWYKDTVDCVVYRNNNHAGSNIPTVCRDISRLELTNTLSELPMHIHHEIKKYEFIRTEEEENNFMKDMVSVSTSTTTIANPIDGNVKKSKHKENELLIYFVALNLFIICIILCYLVFKNKKKINNLRKY